MSNEQKEKFMDKLEDEAYDVLKNFKEHPIKSILVAIFILWGVKQITRLVRGI